MVKSGFIRNFIFCPVFLAMFLVSSFTFRSAIDDCYIQWSPEKTLTREDFRGKSIHKDAVASTVYCIHKEIIEKKDGRLWASVKTYFLCNNSWMLKNADGSEVIEHEQKHFDIAEMFAMKLRKQLLQIEVKDSKDANYKLDSLFKIVSKEMDIYQDTYDNETDHNLNAREQKKWNKKVSRALHELRQYKETDFELRRK